MIHDIKEHLTHSLSSILVVPPSPSNVSVTQLSLTSVRVSWSQEYGVDIDNYIIYYQLVTGGSEIAVQTGSRSKIIRDLEQGGVYSFSVASSNNYDYYRFNSARTDPFNITLGIVLLNNLVLMYLMNNCVFY